jgi:hypothetical protein
MVIAPHVTGNNDLNFVEPYSKYIFLLYFYNEVCNFILVLVPHARRCLRMHMHEP